MSTKLTGPASGRGIVLSRVFVIILGCIGVIWGLATFPVFWQQASLERTASRIISGDQYRIKRLMTQMPGVEAAEKLTRCRPSALHSAAIIRFRIVEQASLDSAGKSIDEPQIESLSDSIRNSLSCSPADPFLWLVLYWAEVTKTGFDARYLNYLRMSYQLAPNEGWVALKRNSFAFVNFERLPGDLVDEAIHEFIRLVRSRQFFVEAADILVGPAWRVRDQILPRLIEVPESDRKIFAQVLQSKGYDVPIPGVTVSKPH
jgi:hypothetical protein